jgi:hypothetical protein
MGRKPIEENPNPNFYVAHPPACGNSQNGKVLRNYALFGFPRDFAFIFTA